MHGEIARDRNCQKPAVQRTTEEEEEEVEAVANYIKLSRWVGD